MSGVAALKALRRAAISKDPVKLFNEAGQETELIQEATEVQFGDNEKKYELDLKTNFYNDDEPQDLKSVVFCWIEEQIPDVDYKSKASEHRIPAFAYLQRYDLITWLKGTIDTCQFVKEEKDDGKDETSKADAKTDANKSKKHKLDDPQLDRISQFERESVDHNAVLRGSKNIDFSYLISDAKKFMHELKRAKPTSKGNKSASGPKKQPIIIVSPATTALLSLSNIKEFLENSRYTEPVPSNRPHSGVVIVNHPSDRLISSGQKIMVVDNVDLFTNPDYWNRVIAIFTTGQSWQFSKYKFSKPEILFQKYQGYYLGYQGEATPPQIKDWNVHEIKVDRGEKRFKDKVIVRDFWAEIDKILVNKGYNRS
ncbi:CDC73 [Candida margitis]|uniref:CDC73 n=1 Tax=Candida margitis TaxID=1775924 RepID=UPI002227C1A2|nr:CDC73 [Candida margitis]KAI5949658.1 CDC73 [Candida margitis]